ncbi:hypothetical protein Ahy_B04g070253 isoform B [Arachis hypogaea]|uniref:Uncharacterized protein n=1 Tax=Arachis hypogaea TaxID=3818 RepID=A0A444ZFU1_ARAHY|nr:hypothetical protein Ahy_B04g070253 isoform B [Arachis hypogaea]
MRRLLIGVRTGRNWSDLAKMQPRVSHRLHRHVVPFSYHVSAVQSSCGAAT